MDLGVFGAAALGGILLGLAAAALLIFHGRIAGISGIVGGLLAPAPGDGLWRGLFVAGLLVGGALVALFHPPAFASDLARPLPAIGLAGLLVGFGARLGSGCTSGHGICGLGRLSPRSIVAVATFIGTGAGIVFLFNLLGGAS